MVSVNTDEQKAGSQAASLNQTPAAAPFTLVHLSDPHISCLSGISVRQLLNKRLYGYLRWKLQRGAEHQAGVLSVLRADLMRLNPDHIAITGDLTHLSLPAEFRRARQWLQTAGSPDQVTVIPGNHDAYVDTDWNQTFAHWADYMVSDSSPRQEPPAADLDSIFPSLRIRGHIAIIGVCSARPCAPYLAVGSIGSGQLQKLETVLAGTADQHLFRVLLIHHPPAPDTVSWRKRLTDAGALRALIARHGVELILHGHAHHTTESQLKTPSGSVAVMGAPSATALGRALTRRARYYIYRICPAADGWDLKLSVRAYSPDDNRFETERECRFSNSHGNATQLPKSNR